MKMIKPGLVLLGFVLSLSASQAVGQSCGSISSCPAASLPLTGSEAMLGVQNAKTVQITVGAIGQYASVTPTPEILQAAQTMTAPALVNVSNTGQIQYANAATGLPANGYITANVTSGNTTFVYFYGAATGFSGLTPGNVFLSTSSPGGITSTPPSTGSTDYVQPVGVAISSSVVLFNPNPMNGPL